MTNNLEGICNAAVNALYEFHVFHNLPFILLYNSQIVGTLCFYLAEWSETEQKKREARSLCGSKLLPF